MNRNEFLVALDEVLEEEEGTVKGDELLEDLDGWDSLAVLGFIAMVDEKLEQAIAPEHIAKCKSVSDLIQLLGDSIKN